MSTLCSSFFVVELEGILCDQNVALCLCQGIIFIRRLAHDGSLTVLVQPALLKVQLNYTPGLYQGRRSLDDGQGARLAPVRTARLIFRRLAR